MKAVSEAYKASMKGVLRNPSHVIIEFGNVDTTAPADGKWASNGAMVYSNEDTLDYSYEYGNPYASLELNRWLGDGSMDLVPEGGGYTKQGFVSSLVSNADGVLSPPAVLTRDFSLEHVFPGLTITFDTRSNVWPRSIKALFWFKGKVVDTVTVKDIQSVTIEVSTSALKVDKVQIEFLETLPYWRPRVENVVYGIKMRFTDKDLISVKQKHDVDPLSRRLPKETFSFTIHDYDMRYDPDNPRGIYAYIDTRSPISIQYGYDLDDGTVEWLKADHYVLDGKPKAKDYKAVFTGTGLIASLTKTYYRGTFGQTSFYDMAEDVLLDAGLTLTEQGTHPWEIDPALKTMYCSVPLPIDSHADCLQLIAHACRCRLYTDDDNIIHIRPFGVNIRGIYSGVWEDNGHERYSEWESVDKNTEFSDTYATLELNRWLGDGTQTLAPDGQYAPQGFVSSKLSTADGSFTEAPVVTRKFDVPHDLPLVYVKFDSRCGEWPRRVQVRYYKNGAVVATKTVDVRGLLLTVDSTVMECDQFDITFLDMIPYRRPRIERVYYQETDFLLDFTTISENSQICTKTDELREISVAMFSYHSDGATQTLFEGTVTDTNFHVDFNNPSTNIKVSVSGGSIVKQEIFARAVDLVLSAGTKTVTITGERMSEVKDVRVTQVNQNGEVDEEKNPLISNETMRSALRDHTIKYLALRNTYDVEYRGNPEIEVGDLIQTQTNYTSELDALVLVDELSFKGSLSGKLKVKGIL